MNTKADITLGLMLMIAGLVLYGLVMLVIGPAKASDRPERHR